MRLPVSMWWKTLAALGFRRKKTTTKHRSARHLQYQSLEARELFTAAPTLDTTAPAVTEQLERGGGVLSMQQLVANMTTYNSLQGIAITGTSLAHGTLQFSTDDGTSWTDVGTVSASNALLLSVDSNTELRLEPTDAYIGDLDNAITFRAWDQVSGTDGSYADTTTHGGSTAFSDSTADATISITPVIGSAFSVGSAITGVDQPPTLQTAVDGLGTSVVAWNGAGAQIFAQFYSASGAAIGGPFEVTGDEGDWQFTLSANASGTFVFGMGGAIRCYQDTGGSITASDPILLTSNADGGFFDVAVTASGAFVAGWSQEDDDGNEQLVVQQFDSSGVALSVDPIPVVTFDSDSYTFDSAQMSVAADGSFAIEWLMTASDDSASYLQALQFNSLGVVQQDSPLDVASWSGDSPNFITIPTITVDEAGGFVAAWMQSNWSASDSQLMARHFDASGAGSAVITVDSNAQANYGYDFHFPGDTVANGNGDWSVVWGGAGGHILGRFYNGEDEPLGDAFQISGSSSNGFGASIGLSSNSQGNLLAAWSVATPTGYLQIGYDFYAQQLQLNQTPTVTTMPSVTAAVGAAPATIELSSYFSDADIPYGDSLTYSASYTGTGVVSTGVSGNELTLSYGTDSGSSTVTVEATDSTGNSISTSFAVTTGILAPLAPASVTEQVERGGGTLSIAQMVAGMTTYNSLQGIAITGTNLAHGTLQYSTNGGTSWTDVGTVSDSSALLLSVDSNTELRFEPTDAYIGDLVNAIAFRAWDQGSGTDGQSGVDTTTNGGITAFSSDTANATISLTPLTGSAISVATTTTASDQPPTLLSAVDGGGTSVVAWQDADQNLLAQFYNASGAAIGSPLQINPTGDLAIAPTVAANANGTFAFAWNGTNGLEVQRYSDTAGVIATIDSAPLVLVSASNMDGEFFNVGVTSTGGLVAGWSQPSSDGTQELLQMQQFSATGVATISPLPVAAIGNGPYSFTSAQMSVAADGSFAMSWMTTSRTDGSQYLQAMQYDAAGAPVDASPLAVANWSSGTAVTLPTISVDGNGGFVSTWMQGDATTGHADLMARHYNSSGTASAAFLIDNQANPNDSGYAVSFPSQSNVNAAGNWGIVWVSGVTGNLMGGFYNSADLALGAPFEVASSGSASIGDSFALASNAQGNLLAAWSDDTTVGGNVSHSFYAQRLQVNPPPIVTSAFSDQSVVIGDPQTIDLDHYFNVQSGDPLTYTASSSNTSIATTSVSGSDLTIDYSSTNVGNAVVTVNAQDLFGNTVTTTFDVAVNSPAPTLGSTVATVQLNRGVQVFNVSALTAAEGTSTDPLGVAITGVNLSEGTLKYSTNYGASGGTTWNTFESNISGGNALLLAANSSTEFQFTPSNAYIGSISDALTFRAWDPAKGTDASGSSVPITSSGGTTAFSSSTDEATLNITPIAGSVVPNTASLTLQCTAVNNQGISVVAWVGGSNNIMAQLYSSNGSLSGPAFQINPTSNETLNQNYPIRVSASANGNFVFAWLNTHADAIEICRVTSTRSVLDAPPLAVSLAGVGGDLHLNYAVSATADGGFNLAYTTISGSYQTVNLVQYDAGWVVCSSTPTYVTSVRYEYAAYESNQNSYLSSLNLETASDGNLVVEWMIHSTSNSQYQLQARQFSVGSAVGSVLNIATFTDTGAFLGGNFSPTLTLDNVGGFVATWPQLDTTGANQEIVARHYDAAGYGTAPFVVVDGIGLNSSLAIAGSISAASNAAGDWGVIWKNVATAPTHKTALMGQFYNAADQPIGSAFQISTPSVTAPIQFYLASNDQGNLVVVWAGQTGSQNGINLQQLQVGISLLPIATQTATVGQTLSFTASATNSTFASDPLVYSLAPGAPLGASINAKTGLFSWTPTEAQFGSSHTITVLVSDEDDPLLSASRTVVVGMGDHAPTTTGMPSVSAIASQSPTLINLSRYFSDVDLRYGDSLSFSATSSNTSLVKANTNSNDLTLTYPGSAGGTAAVTVTATDDAMLTVTATFSVSITGDEPTVTTIPSVSASAGQSPTVIKLANFFSDPHLPGGDSLTYTATLSGTSGIVTEKVSGSLLDLSYPDSGGGTAEVTVTAADKTGVSASTSFAVHVTPGLPGFVKGANVVVPENSAAITKTGWATDIYFGSDSTGTFVLTNTDSDLFATSGAPTLSSSGELTFTPASGRSGTDVVSVSLHTADNPASPVQTFQITVNGTAAPPIASNLSYTVVAGIPLAVTAPGVLTGATGQDGDSLTAVSESLTTSHGSVTVETDGDFTYTPSSGYTGTDSFTYSVTNGTSTSTPATVTLTVVSSPIVANPDAYGGVTAGSTLSIGTSPITHPDNYGNITAGSTVAIDAADGVLANDTPVSGHTLTAHLVAGPKYDTSFSLGADGAFTYSPDSRYAGEDSFAYDDTYEVVSGTTTQTISSPVATVTLTSHAATTATSPPAAVGVLANDTAISGYTLTAHLVTGPAHDTSFSLGANGAFSYAPDSSYAGTDSFVYDDTCVSPDGSTSFTSSPVTVTLTSHASITTTPVTSAYNGVSAGTEKSIALSTGFTDTSGTLSYSIVGNNNPGHVSASISGSYLALSYSGNAAGTDDIEVAATDQFGLIATDQYTLLVNEESLTAVSSSSTTTYTGITAGSVRSFDPSSAFSDPYGSLTYSIAGTSGSAPLSASATSAGVQLTFSSDEAGTESVTLTATDQYGLSASKVFDFSVNEGYPIAIPIATTKFPAVTAGSVESITLSTGFSDTGLSGSSDSLTYSIEHRTNTSLGADSITTSSGLLELSFTSSAAGTDEITVVASDGHGHSATNTFGIRVNEGNPAAPTIYDIPNVTLDAGASTTLDLSQYVSDPDDPSLTYSLSQVGSQSLLQTSAFSGQTLSLTAGTSLGTEQLVFTARDTYGQSTVQTLELHISPDIPQVSSLSLSADLGSGTTHLAYDPTLAGNVDLGSNLDPIDVEFDLNGDGHVDAEVPVDASGNFSYSPAGLTAGTYTVAARTEDVGAGTTGSWTSLTFTLESDPDPSIVSLGLANPTGSSTSEPTTSDPELQGSVFWGGQSNAGEEIQFKFNDDPAIDGTAVTNASGSFTFQPLGLSSGQVVVEARPIGTDSSDGAQVSGSWTSLTFSLTPSSSTTSDEDSLGQAASGQLPAALEAALGTIATSGGSTTSGSFDLGIGAYNPFWNESGATAGDDGQMDDQSGVLPSAGGLGVPLSLSAGAVPTSKSFSQTLSVSLSSSGYSTSGTVFDQLAETVDDDGGFDVTATFDYSFTQTAADGDVETGVMDFTFKTTAGTYSTGGGGTTLTGGYTVDYSGSDELITPETGSTSLQPLESIASYSFTRTETGGSFSAGPASTSSSADFIQNETTSYGSTVSQTPSVSQSSSASGSTSGSTLTGSSATQGNSASYMASQFESGSYQQGASGDIVSVPDYWRSASGSSTASYSSPGETYGTSLSGTTGTGTQSDSHYASESYSHYEAGGFTVAGSTYSDNIAAFADLLILNETGDTSWGGTVSGPGGTGSISQSKTLDPIESSGEMLSAYCFGSSSESVDGTTITGSNIETVTSNDSAWLDDTGDTIDSGNAGDAGDTIVYNDNNSETFGGTFHNSGTFVTTPAGTTSGGTYSLDENTTGSTTDSAEDRFTAGLSNTAGTDTGHDHAYVAARIDQRGTYSTSGTASQVSGSFSETDGASDTSADTDVGSYEGGGTFDNTNSEFDSETDSQHGTFTDSDTNQYESASFSSQFSDGVFDGTNETQAITGGQTQLIDNGSAGEKDQVSGTYVIGSSGSSGSLNFISTANLSDTDSTTDHAASSDGNQGFKDVGSGTISDNATVTGFVRESNGSTSTSSTLTDIEFDSADTSDSATSDGAQDTDVSTDTAVDNNYLSATTITGWGGLTTTTNGIQTDSEVDTDNGRIGDEGVVGGESITSHATAEVDVSGSQSMTFSDIQSLAGGITSDTFTATGNDATTDTSTDASHDTDDTPEASDGGTVTDTDNAYSDSTDTDTDHFKQDSTGLVVTGTFGETGRSGFGDKADDDVPTEGSTPEHDETQSTTDTGTDTSSGTFASDDGILSTWGKFTETDNFTDGSTYTEAGPDSAVDGVGLGTVYNISFFGTPNEATVSVDDTQQDKDDTRETGMAQVSAGITISAGGTYTENDSLGVSNVSTEKDSGEGHRSSTYGSTSDSSGNDHDSDSMTYDSSSDDTFTETSSFTESNGAGNQPSTSSNVSFSASDTTGTSLKNQQNLTWQSKTVGVGDRDENSSEDYTNSSSDASTASNEFQQSGTYSITSDGGVTVNSQQIGTTQNNSLVSLITEHEKSQLAHPVFEHYSTTFSSGGVGGSSTLNSQSYHSQDEQTDAGHTGNNTSLSSNQVNYSYHGSASQIIDADPSQDIEGPTDEDKSTDTSSSADANYNPGGGERQTDEISSSEGTIDSTMQPSEDGPWSHSTDPPTSAPYSYQGTVADWKVGMPDGMPTGAVFTLADDPGGGTLPPPALVNAAAPGAAGPATQGNPADIAFTMACFVARTPIVVADGHTLVEAMSSSELVHVPDDDNALGPRADRQVLDVYRNDPAPVIDVLVDNSKIRCTPDHPFFVVGRGWVAARLLAPGDPLASVVPGEVVPVVGVVDNGIVEPVYNFHVDKAHTYFVATPDRKVAVLVHNSSGPTRWTPPTPGGNYNKPQPQASIGADPRTDQQIALDNFWNRVHSGQRFESAELPELMGLKPNPWMQAYEAAQGLLALGAGVATLRVSFKDAGARTANGDRSLTVDERARIQEIAEKYDTTIDVVGSRANAEGRMVETNLPVGKDKPGAENTTRSDIDFRIDPNHPRVNEMIKELIEVGNGAGRAGKKWGPEPTYPPLIRFNPK